MKRKPFKFYSACPKCGSLKLNIVFCNECYLRCDGGGDNSMVTKKDEHLNVCCPRCYWIGYTNTKDHDRRNGKERRT